MSERRNIGVRTRDHRQRDNQCEIGLKKNHNPEWKGGKSRGIKITLYMELTTGQLSPQSSSWGRCPNNGEGKTTESSQGNLPACYGGLACSRLGYQIQRK